MNCVRYYLCLCILMNHYNVLTGYDLPVLPRIFGGVGSFFAISGFLMFASYEKHENLKGYAVRRLKRILPPYVFIVLLAAVGLCMLSSLPASDYFMNKEFVKYVVCNLCFVNFAAPTLPGVFDENIIHAVNSSLWTMKNEVICYILVPFLYRWFKSRPEAVVKKLLLIIGVCFAVYSGLLLYGEFYHSLEMFTKQFRVFVFFFLGALINVKFKQFMKYKWTLLLIILSLLVICYINYWVSQFVRPFSDSILVIWASMVGSWGVWASRRDSLSYDIYLFHCPIIQTLIATGVTAHAGAEVGLLIAVALSAALAVVSYRFIDRPILRSQIREAGKRSGIVTE